MNTRAVYGTHSATYSQNPTSHSPDASGDGHRDVVDPPDLGSVGGHLVDAPVEVADVFECPIGVLGSGHRVGRWAGRAATTPRPPHVSRSWSIRCASSRMSTKAWLVVSA